MSTPVADADSFRAAADWALRTRAGLRCVAFLALASVFVTGLCFIGYWLVGRLGGLPIHVPLAIGIGAESAGALAATMLMARIDGRRLRDFGWRRRDWQGDLLLGLATGSIILALLMVALAGLSAVSLAPALGATGAVLFHAAFYAVLMLCVAFAEESLLRGYALVMLARCLSFWPAALLLSTLFSLLHGFNSGETPAGLVAVGLFGLVLAYSYRRTGSLWFAGGLHAGWDFTQTFVFGVPDSGVVLPGGLLRPQFHGPPWLTGGSVGPEGSVLLPLALALAVLVLETVVRRRTGGETPGPS